MNIAELTEVGQIQLHLMTTALYFGEFAAIQAFIQEDTRPAIALRQKDFAALKRHADRILVDENLLEADESEKYEATFQHIKSEYEAVIKAQPMPLPEKFMEEISQAALEKGKFLSANNALAHLKKLDKKVNEFVTQGVQKMQAREVAEIDKDTREEAFKLINEAAEQFYFAVRLKKPMGAPYQHLGVDFFTKNAEARRKYDRYVEQGESVLKEIINFCITYLIDDSVISEKIINSIKNNRTRRYLLKQLVIRFTGGIEKHQQFIKQMHEAVENVKNAKTELDFMQTQRILLGRTTGSDTLVQYLKELATRYPVSPLLIKIDHSPANVPFLAPLMLKERSLMEMLELDA